MTTVELRRATKRFGDASIDVSLRVNSGRQLVLLGPSGCGKTTVLRMIAGLTELDAGDVSFEGKSIADLPPERRGVAMVFQEPTLFPFRTVAENVGYGLKVARVPADERRQRVAVALEDVQLPGFGDRWPHELSGGQRQRVAVARAIIVEPRVLLLDEPLASLDPALRHQLQVLLCSVQRRHRVTSIFVTHDQSVARAVADDIAVMIDGTIAQVGPIAGVFADPIDERVACFLDARPRS